MKNIFGGMKFIKLSGEGCFFLYLFIKLNENLLERKGDRILSFGFCNIFFFKFSLFNLIYILV